MKEEKNKTQRNKSRKASNSSLSSIYQQLREANRDKPLYTVLFALLGIVILFCFGHLRERLRRWNLEEVPRAAREHLKEGWVPLYTSFERFILLNVIHRGYDCLEQPICSTPGAEVELLERVTNDHGWTFTFTGKTQRVINMASYNYLGFAENHGPPQDQVTSATSSYGLGVCSTMHEFGNLAIHRELERLVAEFVGVESAIAVGMGYATNSMNIPTIIGKGGLILSDERNHSSIVLGSHLSGAKVRVYKHNDIDDLEKTLKESVALGQPRTGRPWRKILIIVEGVYSMEGSIVRLPEVIALKKRYKAYLYLDEAHSGAMGPRARGLVDFWGCNPLDVDVMMGTFTKSFASVGGYIAGTKKLIDHIRIHSHSGCYASSMSPPVVQQIISTMSVIMGRDDPHEGERLAAQLAWNCRYFRRRLQEMRFRVMGDADSPVVPILLDLRVTAFYRECRSRGLAIAIATFPTTTIGTPRARFCLSAAHSREMIDKALDIIDTVGEKLRLKNSPRSMPAQKFSENDENFRMRYKYLPVESAHDSGGNHLRIQNNLQEH